MIFFLSCAPQDTKKNYILCFQHGYILDRTTQVLPYRRDCGTNASLSPDFPNLQYYSLCFHPQISESTRLTPRSTKVPSSDMPSQWCPEHKCNAVMINAFEHSSLIHATSSYPLLLFTPPLSSPCSPCISCHSRTLLPQPKPRPKSPPGQAQTPPLARPQSRSLLRKPPG